MSYEEKLEIVLDKYPELGYNVVITEATCDKLIEEEHELELLP